MARPHFLDQLVGKFSARAPMDADDARALCGLDWKERSVAAGTYLVREGQPPLRCGFVISGFAYRQKLTLDGQREIVAVLVPNDMIDLQNLHLEQSDHDVIALSRLALADTPIAGLRALAETR